MTTALQCGTVYTWNCAGELYAIECALCEERPLCTLNEFAEHMDVWHGDWQADVCVTSELSLIDGIEDELMQEVLAEQTDGSDNELKQQLVQQLNADEPLAKAQQQQQQQQTLALQVKDATFSPLNSETVAEIETGRNDIAEPIIVSQDGLKESNETAKEMDRDNVASTPNGNPTTELTSELTKAPSLSAQVEYGLTDTLPQSCKLTTDHINKLIELYRNEPRLWNQSHAEFRDVEKCRASWQSITTAWSAHCDRKFSVTDVRIRVSTLCQRFLKQRERLEAEGELDDASKFVHYDHLSFLCEQQALLKRSEHIARENRKLLEIYEHYPILWHNAHKRLRCAETIHRRQEALRGMQLALRLSGINLSSLAVQRRLQSLRKRYRLEKIRYLHSVVEGKQDAFVSSFEHYGTMEFLHKHIDPYVCAVCGKIFENLVSHQTHVQGTCQAVAAAVAEMEAEVDRSADLDTEVEVQGDSVVAAEVEVEAEVQTEVEIVADAETELHTHQEDFDLTVGEIMAQLERNPENKDDETRSQSTVEDPHKELVIKVQCAEFSYELQLPTPETEPANSPLAPGSATDLETSTRSPDLDTEAPAEPTTTLAEKGTVEVLCADHVLDEEDTKASGPSQESEELLSVKKRLRLRLTLQQTFRLIELYRMHACLWDPNHLDYYERKQRREAWQRITELMNADGSAKSYSWQTLHRKLTDYTKYYRRERQREPTSGTKWCFFDAFRFLDDVLPISSEMQKTLQQRDNNLKIISVYRNYEQLWCTDHPDYTKRKQRQRHLESLCTRLQEECNLQITVERLKNRLIDFRYQYRQCKGARLLAVKTNEPWTPEYEYYDALKFLEPHVSPFGCTRCPASFKRRTDFLQHERNVHLDEQEQEDEDNEDAIAGLLPPRKRRRRRAATNTNSLEHICHICGMKFSLRNSLLAHLRRHLGQRTHICNECPKKFFNSTALRVHMRSHTKEQPYVCEHCARGFVNASKLNQHVKRHRGQRDFPCNRCEKAFYTAHERDRHIRAHLNIRDKVCPYCERAFVVGSAYYAHLNLHRGDKRYACMTCGRRFAQYAGLYKHRKRCVPTELIKK